MGSKLFRSRTDSMLGGVCGGLGRYLGVDATLIRLIFVIAALTGPGLPVYFVMWLVIPREGQPEGTTAETVESAAGEIAERARSLGAHLRSDRAGSDGQAGTLVGATLVLLGLIFLVQSMHIPWLAWVNGGLLWPVMLILVGVVLIQRRARTAE